MTIQGPPHQEELWPTCYRPNWISTRYELEMKRKEKEVPAASTLWTAFFLGTLGGGESGVGMCTLVTKSGQRLHRSVLCFRSI